MSEPITDAELDEWELQNKMAAGQKWTYAAALSPRDVLRLIAALREARANLGHYERAAEHAIVAIANAQERARSAERALAAVRALHREMHVENVVAHRTERLCSTCPIPTHYPCPTIAALDAPSEETK